MKWLILIASIPLLAQLKDTGPRYLGSYTVATLPAAASYSGFVAVATDAATAGSCVAGGGTAISFCRSNGTAWETLGGTAIAGFFASKTSSTVLAITAGVSAISNVPTSTAASTATISGSTASSTAYGYISSTGTPTVGHNGAATLVVPGYTVATGILGFPLDCIPLFTATYTNNVWDGGVGIVQLVPTVSRTVLLAGSGVSISQDAGGAQTISIAPQMTRGVFASRPSAPSAGSSYITTDDGGLFSHYDGSSWADYYKAAPITRPGVASGWTVVNGGTLADAGGTLTFLKTNSGLSVAVKAITNGSSNWDLRMALDAWGVWSGATHECGLYVTDGTVAGTSIAEGIVFSGATGGSPQDSYRLRLYSPINGTLADEGLSGAMTSMSSLPRWLRMVRTGAPSNNYTVYIGDGADWVQLVTGSTSFTATHWGVGCDPRGSTTTKVRFVSASNQ